MRIGRLIVGIAVPAAALLIGSAGCGGDDRKAGSGAGGNGAGGLSFGGSAGSCQTAACGGGTVCHPISLVCVTPGPTCAGHAECPTGSYCDPGLGVCLPGAAGSPCAADTNCPSGTLCAAGTCACSGLVHRQETVGALDIYFIFDRTSSMGSDCSYVAGNTPPTQSKACYATYAFNDYIINTSPTVDTRLAFQFMSLGNNDCDGVPYATPLVDLTALPVPATSPIVQAVSNETFVGGFGTHIEGALRGLAQYTAAHVTPGREIIGVLMTDGDPNGCDQSIPNLRQIIADHYAQTGIRTFIIGMEGATESNLEALATAGGADPHTDWCGSLSAPCHYWNVGDASGTALSSALQAIIKQSAPLPCNYAVAGLTPPAGQTLDFTKVNVALTDPQDVATTIGQVTDAGSCPASQPAWYYDNMTTPTTINLCPAACDLVTGAASGSTVSVVVGCEATVIFQ